MLEVLQDANNASDLSSFAGSSETRVYRTSPASQAQNDFGSSFEGYPTFPLIDLSNMQVVHSDCYNFTSQYQGMTTWKACIDEYF